MAKKTIAKADERSGALTSLREIVGKLQEQARDGQIDGALLDQAGAVLDVALDTAPSPTEQPGMAQDANAAAEDVSAPSNVEQAEGITDLPSTGAMAKEGTTEPETSTPEQLSEDESEPEMESDDMTEPTTVKKGETPMSGRPPIKRYTAPNLVFDQMDSMRAVLPDFIKSLESGHMADAQRISGYNQTAFDTMLNLAGQAILTEGGWTTSNLSKLGGFDPSSPADMKKAINASSVPGIYLIRLAKLLLPVYAGLTNRLPAGTPTGMTSNQATWKAQLGFGSIDEAAGFRNAEAAIGQVPPTSFLTFNAPFNDVAYNDSVTLKAIAAGKGYSDPLQISVIKTMSALLRLQERIVLGSNYAAIAAPTSVTASGSSAGGSIAAGSYVVGVTALTYEGWLSGAKGGGSTKGESTATFATTLVTSGATSSALLSWPAVQGAVAYNIYVTDTGAAGSAAKYQKTVLINKDTLTATGGSGLTPPAADTTVNSVGIESLIAWCEKSTVYGNAIPDKISMYDNAGAGLTTGNGGIVQFDSLLESLWTTWHVAPSVMIMSPAMNKTLVGKLLSLNNSSLYRIEVQNERGTIAGGAMVTGYTNAFAPYADGTPRFVDVIPHPYMPNGTVLFLSETIPYPMGNETRGFVRDVLVPYTYFPLASSTMQYNYALGTSETLECFNPPAQSAVVGVDISA